MRSKNSQTWHGFIHHQTPSFQTSQTCSLSFITLQYKIGNSNHFQNKNTKNQDFNFKKSLTFIQKNHNLTIN